METRSPLSLFIDNHYHTIKWCLIVMILVAFGLIIYFLVRKNIQSATLDLLIVPSTAEVKINGQKYDNNTRHYLAPGHYDVYISAENLESKNIPIDLDEGQYQKISTFLTGESGNLDYYKQNLNEAVKLEQIDNTDKNVQSVVQWAKNAIEFRKFLPISEYFMSNEPGQGSTGGYTVKDGTNDPSCHEGFCILIIDDMGGHRDLALQAIKNKGLNPDNYTVIYTERRI